MDVNKLRSLFEDNILRIKNFKEPCFDTQIFSKKFDQLIKTYLKTTISYDSYSSFMSYYFKALEEARKNNIVLATQHIDKAKENLNFQSLRIGELNIYKVSSFTIDAYLLYKKEFYKESIEKTLEVMQLDDLFEKKFPFMFFHKIQQIHNISRVYLKCKNFKKYNSIIDLLFQNLLFNKTVSFENQTFDSTDFNLNLESRILMIYQVFFETIYFLEKNKSNEKQFFNECFKTIIDNCEESICDELKGIFYWAAIKNNLLNEKISSQILINNYLISSRFFMIEIPTVSILKSLNNC